MAEQASNEHDLPLGLAGLRYPITQISLAVEDLEATMALYQRALGWAPWQVFDHVPPVHHATQLRGRPVHYALRGAEVYVGDVNFELLQPLEGPNLWSEFIAARGEGIASIAVMFHERADGDAVKAAFHERFGIEVSMKADIGEHIEYYYLDTEGRFGCLIESGSGHAIDFVRPAQVFPHAGARPGPSPLSGLTYPLSQVSLVVGDLESRVEAFQEAFGWGPWLVFEPDDVPLRGARVRGQPADLRLRLAQAQVGQLNVELVEPRGEGDPWRRHLEEKGEGLIAIGLELPDAAACERARAQFHDLGCEVLAAARVGPGEWTYLDTEGDFKCLIGVGIGHAAGAVTPSRILP